MADSHLYGVKPASRTKSKNISSSTALAFSSNLASLISSSSSKSSTSSGRARPPKDKDDIFKAHNKNVKKRAAADMLDDGGRKHQTKDDIGSLDSVELQRSRRKMEEKARLYNAMKRGDHSHKSMGFDDRGLVDFDRKWAEAQASGRGDESSSSEDESSDQEIVEYMDEFGRLRKGTKAAAEREERRRRIQNVAQVEADEFSARPSLPTNIIYGDTVQHHAFNPDSTIAEKMAEIARKRDKSATPPPDLHFDASAEIRTKGTGFYNFSQDAEERKKQMDALEKERTETEQVRSQREEVKNRRKKEIEERKKLIAEQRSKAEADKFLNEFDLEPN